MIRMSAQLKAAMVVVDMAEGDRRKISWARGCAEEGIILLSTTLRSAAELGIPAVFVADEGHGAILRELSEAAPGAPCFRKSLMSAFSSADFRRHLDMLNPDILVVAGWVSHLCVRDTATDAIREGFRVFTSGDLLFHRSGSPRHPVMEEAELRILASRFLLFPDAPSILAALAPVSKSV